MVYWVAMRNDATFRLLTHEEFARLPTEEKFAYLARAVESPPRKPRSARTTPKLKNARPPVQLALRLREASEG